MTGEKRSNVTWSNVRSFGQLRLLARASLALLICTPLLASAWPAVASTGYGAAMLYRAGAGGGSAAIRIAQFAVGSADSLVRVRAASTCPAATPCDSIALLLGKASQLLTNAERALGSFPQRGRSLADLRLPHTLALLYFASLCFFAGQVIYQLFAPRVVQNFKMEEFISAQLLAYDKARSVVLLYRYCGLLRRVHPTDGPDSDSFEVIELGARREYQLSDEKKRPAAIAALVCFGAASLLVMCVLARQAYEVGEASGWF